MRLTSFEDMLLNFFGQLLGCGVDDGFDLLVDLFPFLSFLGQLFLHLLYLHSPDLFLPVHFLFLV